MTKAIGIDLGTSYTVVAAIHNGRPGIIPNAEGSFLTPSVVAFDGDGKPVIGEQARRQAIARPDRTVFSIKRRMGSSYTVDIGQKTHTPQEISSLILRKVKADAEEYLGEKIERAVITVPAYFNDRQREATRDAGALAGLKVMRIINEPTAAALAYGLENEDVRTVLVWDLGGGTFDVSILELGEGIFEVKAVSGDSWLGGDDFDTRVVEYLEEECVKVARNEFARDASARRMLRKLAEEARKGLSFRHATRVQVPLNDSPQISHAKVDLTREKLESICSDLLQRMLVCAKQALADASLAPEDIERVILVGGATRMPAVRGLARELTGKEPYRLVDPDNVVAMGAAIQAGMLLGLVEKAVLLDVLPLTLGVETQGGLTYPIISRNSPLPASGSRIFTTAADYQTSMDIHVLQGERELAIDNISLGRFRLSDIFPAPRGVAKIEVRFDADIDGIVHISAQDILTGSEVKARAVAAKSLDSHEVDFLAKEARLEAENDRQEREKIRALIEAENLVAAANVVLQTPNEPLAGFQVHKIEQSLSSLTKAIAGGTTSTMKTCSDELRNLLEEGTCQKQTQKV